MNGKLKALAFGVSLLLASGRAGHAQDFNKGMDAYRKGDYATALRQWRPLAEQGNAKVQRILGFLYNEGRGVTRDYKEAVDWYRKSAEQGDMIAQYKLGFMYINGLGVTQNSREAVNWYRRSAEQGSPVAQETMGRMYEQGIGVFRNNIYAHMWYEIAAAAFQSDNVKYAGARERRDRLATRMTPAEIAEAQKLARECGRKKYRDC